MSSDAQALLAKAKESLDAAELLRSRNYFDYAASRAYYSMFYVAEALLAAQGESYSSHSAVIAAMVGNSPKQPSLIRSSTGG